MVAAACGATRLFAAANALERLTPVPADEPIPVIDFFRPSLFSSPSLNPPGTHVAALVPIDELRTGLTFAGLDDGSIKTIRASSDHDVYDYDWLTKDRALLAVSEQNIYASGMYVADVKGHSFVVEQNSACFLISVPKSNPERPLVWIRQNAYDESKDAGVVQIDTKRALEVGRRESITAEILAHSSSLSTYGIQASVARSYPKFKGEVVTSYIADRLGELAFAITARDGIHHLHRLVKHDWIECPVDLDVIAVIAAGDSDDELIVMGPVRDGEPRSLQRLNARTGELGEVIYQDKRYDPEAVAVMRDHKTRALIGLKIWGVGMKTVWFTPKMQEIQSLLDKSFKGKLISIVDTDEKQDRFLIATYSDRQPPVYHRLDWSKKALGLVKESGPWIDPRRTAPMNVIQFKSRDGTPLEGFLTLPQGASEQHPVPLIALPHGGPWASDRWGWDAEAQFLASRGYAVFQPNYRGSTGYDWRFPNDLWDFPKMHQDVTDGVKALRHLKMIDGDRLAIMGASFGGYLALAGATEEPDLYRCAITNAGVFDWQEMVSDAYRTRFEDARYQTLRRNLVDPAAGGADLDRISPLRRVANIKIPIFVAHGREDRVVNIRQSKQLVAELEANHVPHEVFFARGEGHGLEALDHRITLYTAIEAFLARNLAATPTP